MYEITVTAANGSRVRAATALKKAIRAALRRHAATAARLDVALVDDAIMSRLHRKYLGRRGTTDVLSFDLSDGRTDGRAIEGEIVISVDVAAREAKRRGHGLSAEIALYAVHGVLHLLGYDDTTRRDSLRMHRVEREVLAAVGISAGVEA